MKRFLVICALALTLGGCAALGPLVTAATTSIEQPVTRKMYRNVENGLIIATVGLNIYKGKCETAQIDISCVPVVERLQGYVSQSRPVIVNLRVFVRKNDQVNARIAYNTVTQLLSDMRSTAIQAGVK